MRTLLLDIVGVEDVFGLAFLCRYYEYHFMHYLRRYATAILVAVVTLVTSGCFLTDPPPNDLQPPDRRGTTVVLGCPDTVDFDRWTAAMSEAIAFGVAAGDRVEVLFGGPTPSDLQHRTYPPPDRERPSDGNALINFVTTQAARAVEDFLGAVQGPPTGTGTDLEALLNEANRWIAALDRGPARLLVFCTGLQRSERGDILAGELPAFELPAPPPVLEDVRLVGFADFAGYQERVARELRERILSLADDLCARLPGCRIVPSFGLSIEEVWT